MGLPRMSRGTGIVVGIVAGILLLPTASEARTGIDATTTTKTYIRTLAGTDFRSLDVNVFPQLIPNSGGGVYALYADAGGGGYPQESASQFFEAGVDLPNGARVTEVRLYVRNCFRFGSTGYFGAYTPSTGGYAQYATLDVPPSSSCAARTVTRTGSPLTTVGTATSRYVIGSSFGGFYGARNTSPQWALFGARIKYTCTSTCA